MQKIKLTNLESLVKTQELFRGLVFIVGAEYDFGTFGLFHCKEKMEYVIVKKIGCRVSTFAIQSSPLWTISIRRSKEKDRYATSKFYDYIRELPEMK